MTAAEIFSLTAAGASALLAIGVAYRAGRSIARWTFAVGMAVLALECVCNDFSVQAGLNNRAELVRWQEWRLVALSLTPGLWLLFSLTYARGNGEAFVKRWRPALVLAFVLPVVMALGFRSPLIEALYQNPTGDEWLLQLGWSGGVLYLCSLSAAVLVIMNLERTFRASAGTRRWRIKYMLFGIAVLFVVRLYTCSQVLLFRSIVPSQLTVNACALLLANLLVLRSIFRSGNFDLDVYPSQSVLHGSVTLFLAGLYLLIVGAFAKLVEYFGGGESAFALKTFLVLISLVGLTVLLQSDRLRLRLRRFVSRHFQRPLYDYRALWRTFTEGTASRVEQADLARSLVKITADTFQVLSVTIWLVDEKREALAMAASSALSVASDKDKRAVRHGAETIIAHFQEHPDVTDIDAAKDDWAELLRQWHPTEFPTGGNRVCVPLFGRGELLGLMVLSDRVAGLTFSSQDFDILKCIGDHTAASMLNVQLSQKLLQAKELEAFQTMAAFFVHDLKNAASTLNLMLQNLSVHFNDPAFKEDALRGVSKTVTHINHLIGRLGQLRHDLKLRLAPGDLNRVVEQALAALNNGSTPTSVKSLQPLPPVLIDAEQIHKVVTNLVLNGNEAAAGRSPVRVTTERTGDWVVLAVADDGCGMTPEFMRQSLFRPFQTTKKSGLGIGMFQSKMIVEAHQGRIAVASELGKGTTFRVILPVARAVSKN